MGRVGYGNLENRKTRRPETIPCFGNQKKGFLVKTKQTEYERVNILNLLKRHYYLLFSLLVHIF